MATSNFSSAPRDESKPPVRGKQPKAKPGMPDETPLNCPGCGSPIASPFGNAMPGPDLRTVHCVKEGCKRTWQAWECAPRVRSPRKAPCGGCKSSELRPKQLTPTGGARLDIVHCRACGWWAETVG